MALDIEKLQELDRTGYTVLEGIAAADTSSTSTHSHSVPFIGLDGKKYWIKGRAQQGLAAELISGRLAHRLEVGPAVRIMRIYTEILPESGIANHLQGLVVGVEDIPNTELSKDLQHLIAAGTISEKSIDRNSLARVLAFQSWIGVGDPQAMIGLSDGKVHSIDHGDCYQAPDNREAPAVVTIPGIPIEQLREREPVLSACREIEAISDDDILEDVSRMPSGGDWRSGDDRRYAIAEFLVNRRDRLMEVMEAWTM